MSSTTPDVANTEMSLTRCILCQKTLKDPLLLSCLHNVCSSCVTKDFITCPVCRVTSDCGTISANHLVSELLCRSKMVKNVHYCTPCTDQGEARKSAVVWCYNCQQSLCSDCDGDHRKENEKHEQCAVDESTILSDLYRSPSRLCTDHKKEFSSACFTCRNAQCCMCAHACYKLEHDVLPLDDPTVAERLDKEKSSIERHLAALNASSTRIDSHVHLIDNLNDARHHDLRALQDEKKRALNALNRAYENAEASLLQCYDTLEPKTLSVRSAALTLQANVRSSSDYCKMALNSNDTVGLLTQLSTVTQCIQAIHDQAEQMKAPVNPSKLIRLGVDMTMDETQAASCWFGTPRLLSDDLFISHRELELFAESDSTTVQDGTLNKRRDHTEQHNNEDIFQKDSTRSAELKADAHDSSRASKAEIFGSASATIRLNDNCCDVGLTMGGCLLLAAGAGGLLEYCTGGHQLSRWKPSAMSSGNAQIESEVRSVEALVGGRAAVALRLERCVIVLQRTKSTPTTNEVQWVAVYKLDNLRQDPVSLSAMDDKLAVAEWSVTLDLQLGKGFIECEPEQVSWSGVELLSLMMPTASAAQGAQSIVTSVNSATFSSAATASHSGFGSTLPAFTFGAAVGKLPSAIKGQGPAIPAAATGTSGVPTGRQLLKTVQREYKIQCVAITNKLIVTASCCDARLGDHNGDRRAYVLDAHTVLQNDDLKDDDSEDDDSEDYIVKDDDLKDDELKDDELKDDELKDDELKDDDRRLWRHVLTDGEEAWDLCTDSTGSVFYVAVVRSDRSGGRVMTLNAADGKVLNTDVVTCASHLLPLKISRASAGSRTVMAVLCYDKKRKQQSTVSVHPNINC